MGTVVMGQGDFAQGGGPDAYEMLCSTSLRENVLLSLASAMIEDRE